MKSGWRKAIIWDNPAHAEPEPVSEDGFAIICTHDHATERKQRNAKTKRKI